MFPAATILSEARLKAWVESRVPTKQSPSESQDCQQSIVFLALSEEFTLIARALPVVGISENDKVHWGCLCTGEICTAWSLGTQWGLS